MVCLLLLASAMAFSPSTAPTRGAAVAVTRRHHRVLLSDESAADDVDWRELRARLVAQEKAAQNGGGTVESAADGFVYESPLIEQGVVILGGTKQEFGFALRQQYFHKCVMLLLQHDDSFTKGIILNRPSSYELDGWRVWFGGDVAEGGMFRGEAEAKGEREILCLHALESEVASRLSMKIIKGVSYTTLEGARSLVESGEACKADFWVFVGYAGWAPRQLEVEVERDSWFLASADSGTLLQELLRQGTELPPPSSGVAPPGDGLATWESLMTSIGRVGEVERTRGSLPDRMLSEWARVRLAPPLDATADDVTSPVPVGTVLRAGETADRVLLTDQFLHKALHVVVHELSPGGVTVHAVLNRPTANLVQMKAEGSPRRCINFGGDGRLRGKGLDIDDNGLMWLAQAASLGEDLVSLGTAIGNSGLRRLPALQAAESIRDGKSQLTDFLLVSGLVCFTPQELSSMIRTGELHVVDDAASLWPRVWKLADAAGVEDEGSSEGGALLSDGTGVWWAAAQLGKKRESRGQRGDEESDEEGDEDGIDALLQGLQGMPPSQLADEALDEWLKFFAGHKKDA